jgi:nitrate/nitrite transporter NarK
MERPGQTGARLNRRANRESGSSMSAFRRWLVMACLCLSGGIIFLLPFLREVYYIPLQKALRLTNTQLGVMMSVFGAVSLLTYFPGGWLADRVSSRKLISFSMLATGLAGFYFASFPSYPLAVAVHGFWGATCSLTFWGAMIKATRNWAPASEQGRAFGILESGRGIAELASSTAFLAVFAALGSGDGGLSRVIVLFSVIDVLLAVMAWFSLVDPKEGGAKAEDARSRIELRQMLVVLRMPAVWLMSVVVLAAYSAYWGAYYFTPYATDVFLMSVVFGGAIGVGKMWVKPLAALGAGFLADRAGVARTVTWSFGVLVPSFAVFAMTPGNPKLVFILVMNTGLSSLAIFALRGIYFALLEEGGVPAAVTGTAAGLISALGFTPDVFMPLLGGVFLDRYPGAPGYRYLFLTIVVLCAFGFLAAFAILKRYARRRQDLSVPADGIRN